MSSSIVTKSVDFTQVNYITDFTYTINVSFSSVQGDINNATLIDYIPDTIQFTLLGVDPSITVTQETVGNNIKLTFDFGAIIDTGVAYQFKIKCRFKSTAVIGDTFTNTAQMFVNGNLDYTAEAPTVTLQVTGEWGVQKYMVSPVNDNPVAGGYAYYAISLKNFGDAGAVLSNFKIIDYLPEEMTIDNTFVPSGVNNGGGVVNPDPVIGVYNSTDNSITWSFVSYSGTWYTMFFKVLISHDIETPKTVVNLVNLVNDQGTIVDFWEEETTISNSVTDIAVGKYGPVYSQKNAPITYELYLNNSGNTVLNNVSMIDNIPSQIIIDKVFPGNFGIRGSNVPLPYFYQLYYSKDSGGSYLTDVNLKFNYNGNNYWTYVDLLQYLNPGEKITNLKWVFETVGVEFIEFNGPRLDGTVDPNAIGTIALNTVDIYDENEQFLASSSVTTTLAEIAALNGNKVNYPAGNVQPGDIIRYEGRIYGSQSRIKNPMIIDLLPEEVEYADHIMITYQNYFNQWVNENIDPNSANVIVTQEPNYNGTGRVRLTIELNPFILEQRGNLFISFENNVKPGVKGTISNNLTIANNGQSAPVMLNDSDDYDNDGITEETLLLTSTVTNVVPFSSRYNSDKKVKGSLDTEYTEEPLVGKTYQGGSAQYKLTFYNTSNTTFQNIEIVDILPYIGDVGVITGQPRNSQFAVSMGNIVTATLTNVQSGDPVPQILIEYSTSTDPVRFNQSGTGTIGTGTWTVVPPSPITLAKSFKITTIGDTIVKPGQSLIIDIDGVAPVGALPNQVAWNSFALRAEYIDENNKLTALLPVEPEKVGIEVLLPSSGSVQLGNYVWFDINGNGIYETGEPGVNGVQVDLFSSGYDPYNESASLISTTITTDNASGLPGYYLFNNLNPNKYIIKFIPPDGYYLTTQNLGVNGSKPNQTTGVTNLITTVTASGSVDLTIDAGIYQPAVIGGLVWLDCNMNGVVDSGEKGQPNALVTLYTCEGQKTQYSAITDANGNYSISGIQPGRYRAVFSSIPQENIFVTAGNYVTNTGMTPQCIEIESGQNIDTINAPTAFNNIQKTNSFFEICKCIDLIYLQEQKVCIDEHISMGYYCISGYCEPIVTLQGEKEIVFNYCGTYIINYKANVSFAEKYDNNDFMAVQFIFNNERIIQGYGYARQNGALCGNAVITVSEYTDASLYMINAGTKTMNMSNFEMTIMRV